jgi:segregation and condensation protein B
MSDEIPGWPLKRVIEAILFASQRPVSTKDLQGILKSAAEANKQDSRVVAFARIREPALRAVIDELGIDCADLSRSYELRESAAGWQLVTKSAFAPWLRQLFPEYRSARLSAPALETLAIIAYRQPITRADIEAVRGVAVDGVVQTLLERGLVKIAGRAEIPGRPLLYETTQNFMDHFGLRNLDELPNAEELRRVRLPLSAAQSGVQLAKPTQPPQESRDAAGEEMPGAFHNVQTDEKSS